MDKPVTAQSYTLRTQQGAWLGQIVLTSDGMFAAVSDWGNFSYAWRSFGTDFKKFLLELRPDYFAVKMSNGMAYVTHGKKIDQAAKRFAEEILPALQYAIKEELLKEISAN